MSLCVSNASYPLRVSSHYAKRGRRIPLYGSSTAGQCPCTARREPVQRRVSFEYEQHSCCGVPGVVEPSFSHPGGCKEGFPLVVIGSWVDRPADRGWANTHPPSCHNSAASLRSAFCVSRWASRAPQEWRRQAHYPTPCPGLWFNDHQSHHRVALDIQRRASCRRVPSIRSRAASFDVGWRGER